MELQSISVFRSFGFEHYLCALAELGLLRECEVYEFTLGQVLEYLSEEGVG